MDTPMLQIFNHHYESCGMPPQVTNKEPGKYVGYFENRFGEQWILQVDYETKDGELRGGDIGWSTVYPIRAGQLSEELILGDDEKVWITACLKALWCLPFTGGFTRRSD